jgi:hypothetical protein
VLNFLRAQWPLILGILTGPIGLAVVLIIKYWAQISGAFTSAYHSVVGTGTALVGWVAGLPGKVGGALSSLGGKVYSAAVGGFARLKAGATTEAAKMLTYVGGLPGQIKSAVGDLSGLLADEGKHIVQGLWSGISSLGDWLAGKISSLVKDKIPGPVRKVLGINSPSKVMAELGTFIGQGLVVGITGQQGAVAGAMASLASVPTAPSLIAGTATVAAAGTSGLASGTRVYIVLEDGTELAAYVDTRVDRSTSTLATAARAGRKQ